jgi:hypothetical protein
MYDAACEREGAAMVPFAMESYGAHGKEARKLLLKLADASEELSAEAFLRHASAALSVALQCGNADIAAKVCNRYVCSRLRQRRHRSQVRPAALHDEHRAVLLTLVLAVTANYTSTASTRCTTLPLSTAAVGELRCCRSARLPERG